MARSFARMPPGSDLLRRRNVQGLEFLEHQVVDEIVARRFFKNSGRKTCRIWHAHSRECHLAPICCDGGMCKVLSFSSTRSSMKLLRGAFSKTAAARRAGYGTLIRANATWLRSVATEECARS